MLCPLSTCARGSVSSCAIVLGVTDIGATFVEVDIQGLLMTVFSLYFKIIPNFPRPQIQTIQDRQRRMGGHIHHMQPVTPRDISVKYKIGASIITLDYGVCNYCGVFGFLSYINSTCVTKFCSYIPEFLFSWV